MLWKCLKILWDDWYDEIVLDFTRSELQNWFSHKILEFFFQKTVWRKELTWEPTEKLMRTCFEKAAIWCGLAKNEFCSNLTLTLPGCLTMWCISNSTLSLQSALKIECPHKKLTSHQKHFNLRLLRMHPQSLNAQNSIFLNDLFYFSTETPKILYQQVFN